MKNFIIEQLDSITLHIEIPNDKTEAEIYLIPLQEEFNENMNIQLGNKYLPGNSDLNSIIVKGY
jgi:hypothetical protein